MADGGERFGREQPSYRGVMEVRDLNGGGEMALRSFMYFFLFVNETRPPPTRRDGA
jgi:hypothetical protein